MWKLCTRFKHVSLIHFSQSTKLWYEKHRHSFIFVLARDVHLMEQEQEVEQNKERTRSFKMPFAEPPPKVHSSVFFYVFFSLTLFNAFGHFCLEERIWLTIVVFLLLSSG